MPIRIVNYDISRWNCATFLLNVEFRLSRKFQWTPMTKRPPIGLSRYLFKKPLNSFEGIKTYCAAFWKYMYLIMAISNYFFDKIDVLYLTFWAPESEIYYQQSNGYHHENHKKIRNITWGWDFSKDFLASFMHRVLMIKISGGMFVFPTEGHLWCEAKTTLSVKFEFGRILDNTHFFNPSFF